jgi:uncharacterized protein
MIWVLLAAAALAAMVGVCYWGAGIILFPPEKSPLQVFPEQFGMKYEKVSFKTSDGLNLKGWFMPSPTGEKKTLLMCHGWGDNKGHLLERTYFLNTKAGYNLLYFDHRSHGESEGEITTIGYLELIDCEAALGYLAQSHPDLTESIGVFGLSMGGSVGVMTMAQHPQLKCGVMESPFTDYKRVVRQWAWNHFRLPYFPMVWLTLYILRLRVGKSEVDAFSPIKFVAKIAPRPLFLIGGTDDALMPPPEVKSLFEKAGEPKQLWMIPGATHAQCYKVAGLEFEERVMGFYRKHL